jgi:hypothetical protein
MDATIEMFVDELAMNEELRDQFFRNPQELLAAADDWGLPFCASEICRLLTARPSVWRRVAEEVDARVQQAA